eukprot:CAMPEP_0117025696 /NCGR_PEP_ID=MMETSP0472-20121206/18961_1 /TAXON_ID=693140 ORGANISM="Tiarina fusus, Strain LIS" /NCGR_SAMPLE_ID=MMETSP0472 /ASSEMBLY_ACC=CAM_ASM_000603 /LENGTH=170 /DNA_ID=CAMNT_0004732493 /DNA_START=46 /DNA_END=555 /DNA_ORIENTATION=+
MSKQRKHVEEEILTQFPEPIGDEQIAHVIEAKGRNLLEIEYSDGNRVLAMIPSKYHKKVWIKNGNFVIVRPTTLPDATSKVLAIIRHPFLGPQDIQHLMDTQQWPPEFLHYAKENMGLCPKSDDPVSTSANYIDMDFMSDGDSDDSDDWGHNPNRTQIAHENDESSDEYD